MQIVINNVSEEEYKDFCDRYIGSHNPVINAMCNGTPLPKGHGDLKDVSKLHYVTMLSQNPKTGKHKHITVVRAKEINDAPTIIETDKEQKE